MDVNNKEVSKLKKNQATTTKTMWQQ
jgi:hypothetical protein